MCLPFLSNAGGPNYTLDVKMKNIPDSVIFTLGCDDDPKYKVKKPIIGDSLHFELEIMEDYPVEFYLTGRNPNNKSERFITSFYGGKGINQKLTATGEGFFVTAEAEGAPWDEAIVVADRYQIDNMNKCKAIQNERMKYFPQDKVNTDEAVRVDSVAGVRLQELTRELLDLQDARDKFVCDWIMNNPDVPEAVGLMTWRYTKFSREDLEAFGKKVPSALMEMPKGQVLKKILESKVIKPGDKLEDYDIVGVDVDSVAIRLSQFTTPYILVDFNSLGCGACRSAAKKEIPTIIEKYGDKLTFVSFSVDEGRKQMLRAHELDKATWPTIWDGEGSSGAVCLKYGVTGYPTFFLFGPDRKLLETRSGWGPGMLERWFGEYISAEK